MRIPIRVLFNLLIALMTGWNFILFLFYFFIYRVEAAIPRAEFYPYYDKCHRKDLNFNELLLHDRDFRSAYWQTNRTVNCETWEYNLTQIPYKSIGAEVRIEKNYKINSYNFFKIISNPINLLPHWNKVKSYNFSGNSELFSFWKILFVSSWTMYWKK